MTDPTHEDVAKLSLKVDLFRRSLARVSGKDDMRRTLLLQTVAATDAGAGAVYLHDRDEMDTFGDVRSGLLRRRLAGIVRDAEHKPGSLLLDEKDAIAAPLWRYGGAAGALYVAGRQWETKERGFTALDRALLLALAATASIAVEQERLERENRTLRRQVKSDESLLIGSAEAVEALRDQIATIAQSEITVPVLIEGESGTGKELVARSIHNQSSRREEPFVVLNCAAIPTELLESELFGHEKGAFTGAISRKAGKFEAADGGTVFLDEIGEMAPDLQAKLLRVLENGTFTRVGGNQVLTSDFQLISATNRTLREEVKEGRFREDLYYRLATFEMQCPPLRERRDDVPILVDHFLAELNAKSRGRTVRGVTPRAMRILMDYEWPGNVRQLRRIIERAFVVSSGSVLDVRDLPDDLTDHSDGLPFVVEQVDPLEGTIARYVRHAYHRMGRHKTNTMKVLGIDYRRLQRYLEMAETIDHDA